MTRRMLEHWLYFALDLVIRVGVVFAGVAAALWLAGCGGLT